MQQLLFVLYCALYQGQGTKLLLAKRRGRGRLFGCGLGGLGGNFHRLVDDRAGESITLNNMGELYRIIGQLDKALELYEQALSIMRQAGNREGEAVTCSNTAILLREAGKDTQALESLRQAVLLMKQVQHPVYVQAAALLALEGSAKRHFHAAFYL